MMEASVPSACLGVMDFSHHLWLGFIYETFVTAVTIPLCDFKLKWKSTDVVVAEVLQNKLVWF
jgi:hypothetical protein